MWIIFNLKKEFRKISESFKRKEDDIKSLKVQVCLNKSNLDNLDLDKRLDRMERRINERIDNLLGKALDREKIHDVHTVQISPNLSKKSKSKESLRQVQEKRVIHAFKKTKKETVKQKILLLQENNSIPSIKAKIMQEFALSKATFYNYLKELDSDVKVQISPNLS